MTKPLRPYLPAVLYLAAVTATGAALAQSPESYKPQSGQPGKDVVWVPTAQVLVDKMLDLAKVGPGDYVIDLGSGDGRTVITAAKRGARAHGIEYNPDMVALSKRNAEEAGIAGKATFAKADIFESDFSQATVLTLFLLPSLNVRLRPTILKMKPGTRVVSNSFDMGDWEPDAIETVGGECANWCRALYWTVPAEVGGTWQLEGSELTLEQKYQKITGRLTTGNVVAPLMQPKLTGPDIGFTAAGVAYTGKVAGDVMEGTRRKDGTETPWRATRK